MKIKINIEIDDERKPAMALTKAGRMEQKHEAMRKEKKIMEVIHELINGCKKEEPQKKHIIISNIGPDANISEILKKFMNDNKDQ